MPKLFLYLGGLALLAFVISRQFATPDTWTPFVEGCTRSGASFERCECLADYIHDRLSEAEVRAVMANRVAGASFEGRVHAIVEAGTQACR
ncbi:hypothetical protein [Motiliproteus sp. SC1-56]|uniref:hypothetical protein n=1 Tax=Motiliproteus sp. SC1-56 TaxID=2799565 RepID=UPI001A907935|nr:hypothetical protein [Motiliproteus sp. SC1-56]